EPKAPKQAGSDIGRSALALSNLQMVRRDFAFEVESPIPAADIVRAAPTKSSSPRCVFSMCLRAGN
ncbi:MAG: hypothetical protein VX091_00835, partial [Pseudomonadota bacterium]|nr:hypothetical protein [Pseudomonadota bacterium]